MVNAEHSDGVTPGVPESASSTDGAPTTKAPIHRAAFAELAGVSKAAITKACRGALAAACDDRGRVFVDHPAAQAYIAAQNPTDVSEADVDRATALALRVGARVVVRAARWLLHRAERLERAAQ
ncbi:MAG: hypothetical protein QM756_11085 [Polyangiaceae bacterium]